MAKKSVIKRVYDAASPKGKSKPKKKTDIKQARAKKSKAYKG